MESIYTECARTDNVFSHISEVCDGTVSLYEAFDVMGVVGGISLHCLHEEREKWRLVGSSLHLPFPPEIQ